VTRSAYSSRTFKPAPDLCARGTRPFFARSRRARSVIGAELGARCWESAVVPRKRASPGSRPATGSGREEWVPWLPEIGAACSSATCIDERRGEPSLIGSPGPSRGAGRDRRGAGGRRYPG
jgi:hypothetical protein